MDVDVGEVGLKDFQRYGERAEDVEVVLGVEQGTLLVEDGHLIALVDPDLGDAEEARLRDGGELVADAGPRSSRDGCQGRRLRRRA